MVLKFFLLAITFLLISCSVPERDSPYDPESSNYIGNLLCQSEIEQQEEGPLAELDVIIRDFPVTYPGFEEFDSQKNGDNRQCNGDNATKGMVQNKLDYSQCSQEEQKGNTDIERAINGRYCARPIPANQPKLCYGENLQTWFTDGSQAKTIIDAMTLTRTSEGLYEIIYNNTTQTDWNGYGKTEGYFPLDKYPDGSTYGKQSLAVWCPSQTYATGTCATWWASGGPKDPSAAIRAANSQSNLKKDLHNFGFTIAGSAEFKYVAANNDNIAFSGDDDIWMFIDGELVMDLGGVHQALSDSVNIDDLARQRGWSDGSIHSINFFYAERQTEASNLMLRFKLTNLSVSRFGAPRILKAETTQKQDGTSATAIYVNNKLDLESLVRFIGSDQFPILIKKQGSSDLLAYRLERVISGPLNMGSQGYVYITTGQVCKSRTECGSLILNSGDSLSFNVKMGQDVSDGGFNDPNRLGLPDESWYIKSVNNRTPATTKSWATTTTCR